MPSSSDGAVVTTWVIKRIAETDPEHLCQSRQKLNQTIVKKLSLILLVLMLLAPGSVCAAEIVGAFDPSPADVAVEKKTSAADESYFEQIKKLLEEWTDSTKKLGSKSKAVSEQTKNWLQTDFKKIGDWNYKQVAVPLEEIANLEKVLNEHGAERWECFFVQPQGREIHLLFKRPSVSYLHKLSQVDFLRMLSSGGEVAAEAAE
ncbi:MAG: hypothetical protein ACJASX_003334 [Limisphaerales bacterium]|jgi:hypothetical protein